MVFENPSIGDGVACSQWVEYFRQGGGQSNGYSPNGYYLQESDRVRHSLHLHMHLHNSTLGAVFSGAAQPLVHLIMEYLNLDGFVSTKELPHIRIQLSSRLNLPKPFGVVANATVLKGFGLKKQKGTLPDEPSVKWRQPIGVLDSKQLTLSSCVPEGERQQLVKQLCKLEQCAKILFTTDEHVTLQTRIRNDVQLFALIGSSCCVCGRELKTDKSMRKAMGSTCAKLWNGYFGENSITAL
jgi:hypothetical protein